MMKNEYVIILSRAILYLIAAFLVVKDSSLFTIGMLSVTAAWMERLFSNYYRLNDCVRHLYRGRSSLSELLTIFETQSSVPRPENPKWPTEVRGRIEFRDVSFAYADGSDALKGINLIIEPNEVIAIIGASGSGKSTLSKLLALDYLPTGGDIFVDGVNLKEFDPERYRNEMIGLVLQAPQLFDESIAANIRLGNLTASIEEVRSAATAAHAHSFIEATTNGYDTIVGDNGIRLSGGQKQRLTIARALVRNPRILILDEATSSLDCESQLMVQEAIDERIASNASTTIIIAHRFSTIEKAHRVIALENGEIVEIGTHDELSRQNGIYARFRALETQGYLA